MTRQHDRIVAFCAAGDVEAATRANWQTLVPLLTVEPPEGAHPSQSR